MFPGLNFKKKCYKLYMYAEKQLRYNGWEHFSVQAFRGAHLLLCSDWARFLYAAVGKSQSLTA